MFEPAYLKAIGSGQLRDKVVRARKRLENCGLCPRNCGVNRLEGETGFCGTADKAAVDSATPHFGEEDCLVGHNGSGTIFFSSCNLKCVFCQNYEISHAMEGEVADTPALGKLMLGIQSIGCHNVNTVTPSHVVPQLLAAVEWAADKSLRIPWVFNCGGYESVETLQLLDGVVDIYMPDLKFADASVAKRLLHAEDYPETARAAIKEMHRQVGDLEINEHGIAVRGLLVRHLVMPNGLAGTRENMRFLAREISPDTYVNIMDQYRPRGTALDYPEIGRATTRKEYADAVEMAREDGLTRLDTRTGFRMRFI
ncbi:MAG: radical SAM protein [Pseudomonadota bacterium]